MEILSFTPSNKLIEQVRNTTMLTDKSVFPYKNADICIEDMAIDEFMPTQLYVLKEHLKIQESIRGEFLEKGYDTLRLRGGVLLRNAGVLIGMMPPIIEDDCEFGPCLLDGTHRAYLAKLLGHKSISVVHVSGVLIGTPMIPLPNKWSEIVEYDIIPTDKNKKKRYRDLPDKYSYYRDFSEITGIAKDPRSEMIVEV